MNRSLFPEGVEVHQRHLENTETTKAKAIVDRTTDIADYGVVSGLVVSVNGVDTTRVDITSGAGYAPNGERVTLSANQTSVQLASYAASTKNYILLMYDELQSLPEAHETDGTTRNTKVVESSRLVVVTEAAYNAMADTDRVLSNNARDRALIIAIVTANGSGVALTSSSIVAPSTFDAALAATQPINITGIQIIAVGASTPSGVGSLSFTAATKVLKWQAPGEGGYGANKTLTASQAETLTSLNGHTLLVNVSYSILSSTDQTDNITISDLYSQSVPRFSAVDMHHRSMIGSGQPSASNPHGMTLDDLSPGAAGSLEVHQDLMHSNGIWSGSSTSLLSSTVDTTTTPDRLNVTGFTTGDALYINGKMVQSLASSSTITFNDGHADPATYSIYITQDGVLFKQLRAKFPATGASLHYLRAQIIDVSPGIGATSKNLVFNTNRSWQFDGGPAVTPSLTVDSTVRLMAQDRVNWIDLFVKGGLTAPGGTETDSITFTAEADSETNFMIAQVPWSGSATGYLGTGWGVANAPNRVTDKRLFGTLSIPDISDSAGYSQPAKVVSEIINDGLAFYSNTNTVDKSTDVAGVYDTTQFNLGSVSALTIPVEGGVAYVGGRRFEVSRTVVNLTDNATNTIYVNHAGQIVATSSGILSTSYNRPYLHIWDITLSAGAETSRTDRRANHWLSLRKNKSFGVLGLDSGGRATISSTSGTTLTVNAGFADFTAISTVGKINLSAAGTAGGGAVNIEGQGNFPLLTVVLDGDNPSGMSVDVSGGTGYGAKLQTSTGLGLDIDTTTGTGIDVDVGVATGIDVYAEGSTPAINIIHGDTGPALKADAQSDGKAIEAIGSLNSLETVVITSNSTNAAAKALKVTGNGGIALDIIGSGTTKGLNVAAENSAGYAATINNTDGGPGLEVTSTGADTIKVNGGFPSISQTGLQGFVTQGMLTRAWTVFISDNLAARTGVNISNVTLGVGFDGATSSRITITFATPMPNANYIPIITIASAAQTNAGITAQSGGHQAIVVQAGTNANQLQFDVYTGDPPGACNLASGNGVKKIFVAIIGCQA